MCNGSNVRNGSSVSNVRNGSNVWAVMCVIAVMCEMPVMCVNSYYTFIKDCNQQHDVAYIHACRTIARVVRCMCNEQ